MEDDRDLRTAYAECLQDEGYEVAVAENGLRALQIVRSQSLDVILMDLSLPVIDGWEATRVLKQDPRTREIPVVAITGRTWENFEADARTAGCDATLRKPCEVPAITDAISKVTRAAS